jgi:alanyl-tRNA synthetase
VLRRIIRRAIRHGYRLGASQPFFYQLVAPLVEEMGEAYPGLKTGQAHVERILRIEEERFAETLEQGMRILEEGLAALQGTVIPGETVFRLYDTYGFPVDLTADIARERGLTLDVEGFERAMEAQRSRARAASQFAAGYSANLEVEGCTISPATTAWTTPHGHRPVQGRQRRRGACGRRGGHRRPRAHAVLRRIRRPGRDRAGWNPPPPGLP